jgi:predicted nuclease of predicted toxin-antitoxin system
LRFIVDAQLPRALCRQLGDVGHDAVHVSDLLLASASDDAIWRLAGQQDLVIVSKDEDFARRAKQTTDGPSVIWIRVGNRPNKLLWAALGPVWSSVCAAIQAGERLVEVY